jgi:RND family efflux transporter MFP subunit
VANYNNTTWYVRIPNQESSVYTTNYAAYQKALRDRQVAIENARASLSKSNTASSVAEAEILRAKASLAQIDAKIAERQIRVPFAGIVSKIDLDLGESVTAGEALVAVASEAEYEMTANVPEADINKLSLGNLATATLDAYPDGSEFLAEIVSIEPAETVIDGVSTYKVTLQFKNVDDKIKSGMTADIVITGAEKRGVLAVPLRAVSFRDGGAWVRVVEDGKLADRQIVLGLRGSDGLAEVVSGLSEGELVSSSSL